MGESKWISRGRLAPQGGEKGLVSARAYDITIARAHDRCTVSLSGEIDFAATLELSQQLDEAARQCNGRLVFDLDEVTHIDSEGIKALIRAVNQVKRNDGSAEVVRCSRIARRVIEIVGIEEMMGLAHDPDPRI